MPKKKEEKEEKVTRVGVPPVGEAYQDMLEAKGVEDDVAKRERRKGEKEHWHLEHEKIKDYEGRVIVEVNQEISEDLASAIQAAGIERVKIRSVLTCESRRGACVPRNPSVPTTNPWAPSRVARAKAPSSCSERSTSATMSWSLSCAAACRTASVYAPPPLAPK